MLRGCLPRLVDLAPILATGQARDFLAKYGSDVRHAIFQVMGRPALYQNAV